MRGERPAGVLLALAAAVLALVATGKKPAEAVGWRLPHHSFERTLSYDDNFAEWLASAGSIPLRDRMQITPPVANRYGFFWSRKAISSKFFEVRFTVSATDDGDGSGARDGAFTFWLSPDSGAAQYDEQAVVSVASKDWAEGLQKIGLTLLSNRPTFRGLALTFVNGQERMGMGALLGDGSAKALADLTSTASGAKTSKMPWMTAGTQVKVLVTNDGQIKISVMRLDIQKYIVGSLWSFTQSGSTAGMVGFKANNVVTWDDKEEAGTWKLLPGNRLAMTLRNKDYVIRFECPTRAVVEEPKTEPQSVMFYGGQDAGDGEHGWERVFTYPAGSFNFNEVYMGFTAYTGSASSMEINLHRLQTTNFDERRVGEDDGDILAEQGKEWLEVLEKEKRYLDQASQAEAVLRLTQLLSTHVQRCGQEGDELKKTLLTLEGRLDNLGTDMSTYLAAAKSYSMDTQKFDPELLKGSIMNIRSLISSSPASDLHTKVHQAAEQLKAQGAGGQLSEASRQKVQSVQDQARAVEAFAAAGSSQANYLLLAMVLAVAGLAMLFLHRMRYYERKHYI